MEATLDVRLPISHRSIAQRRNSRLNARALLLSLLLAASSACSNSGSGSDRDQSSGGGGGGPAVFSPVAHWNSLAIDASGLDHTPGFGQQLGPCRAARAMAIVHIAIFEAANAISQTHESYVGLPPAPAGASMRAAVAVAAHDTLSALYSLQSVDCALALADELTQVPAGDGKLLGIAVGKAAAKAILAMRKDDGSELPEPLIYYDFAPGIWPGDWRPDPISKHPLALGGWWNQVTPFVMTSVDQCRVAPPPALPSAEYAAAFAEVLALGGDGVTTPTVRTDEQTFIGIFWAYDGMPSLCAPPRLYNQIAIQIAKEQGTSEIELARLLALVNVAMADAGSAIWESKYFYEFWRPVGGIREADLGSGLTGMGDENPATLADFDFMPLGAPASNGTGPNFTPPFPAYPSGHAGFGGALFQVLRRFYGTDDIEFTVVSDEWNGVTVDNQGNVRPLIPRTFSSLSQAEEENGQSRIYLGIHWSFDKTAGIAQGNTVADIVFDTLYRPLP